MKKGTIVLLAAVLTVLMTSCGVNPKQAIQNFQHPKIGLKTTVRIPVIATSVNTGEFIMSSLKNLEKDVEGLHFKEGNPVLATYSNTFLQINPDDLKEQIPELSEEIPINLGVTLPTIGKINSNVDAELPTFSSVNMSIHLPGVLAGESTTDSTDVLLNMGVDSSKLISFKISGGIEMSVDLPWSDVSLIDVNATVTDGKGNIVSHGTYSSSGNKVYIDLSGKSIEVGNGNLKISFSLTLYSKSPHGEGDIILSVKPEVEIDFVKGLKIDFSQRVDKPSGVEELDIESGKLVIRSSQLEFASVSGSIGGNPMSVDSGRIITNLESINLPVDINIDTVDATVKSLESPIDINGDLEDLNVATLVYLNSDLDVSSTKSVSLSSLAQLLRSIKFSAGEVTLEYESSLPMDVNVVLNSSDFDPILNKSFVIEKESSSKLTLLDLSSERLLVNNSFDISYNASPENYDGERLVLNNVTLGSNLGISATIVIDGIKVSQVTLNSTTVKYNGKIPVDDLSVVRDLLPYLDISGTLVSNIDISGTIDATFNDQGASVTISSGETSMNDLIDALKSAVSESESNAIIYDVDLNIESAVLDVDKPMYARVEAEMPLELNLGSDEISVPLSDLLGGPVDISSLHTSGSEVHSATLLIEGTNTTGMSPRIVLDVGSAESSLMIGEGSFSGEITVSGSDLEGNSLPISATAVLTGDQKISSEGFIDLIVKLIADVTVSTEGGDEE